jgi:hypothetical protein
VSNGVEVMSYDGDGILNDVVHREHGIEEEGVIALQIHKGEALRVRIKDIYVKEVEMPKQQAQ